MSNEVNLILDAIEREKCILLLGPELNNLDGKISQEEVVYRDLISELIFHHIFAI